MDPLRLCLAFGPVAVYLLLLGAINLSRRPFLVSGTRDAAALAVAVAGLVIVGPVELFFPQAAAMHFGAWVWVLLAGLYGLAVVLLVLMMRPRLVIYNISVDQLRPILAEVVDQLDARARWAGDSLILPSLGVQMHIDSLASMRNVSLVSAGPHQSLAGWRRMELALAATLAEAEVARNPRAISFLSAGTLIVLALVLAIARDPQSVARSLLDVLNL